METVLIYPGTFCLAHWAHKRIVERVTRGGNKLTIICSVNENKDPWFNPEECKKAWQVYDLGDNVTVVTLAEFLKTYSLEGQEIIMVRGIRNEKDLAFEKKVLEQNRRDYGIIDYRYLLAEEKYMDFSSTKARKLALEGNLEELEEIVHKKLVPIMIERAREIKKEAAK